MINKQGTSAVMPNKITTWFSDFYCDEAQMMDADCGCVLASLFTFRSFNV